MPLDDPDIWLNFYFWWGIGYGLWDSAKKRKSLSDKEIEEYKEKTRVDFKKDSKLKAVWNFSTSFALPWRMSKSFIYDLESERRSGTDIPEVNGGEISSHQLAEGIRGADEIYRETLNELSQAGNSDDNNSRRAVYVFDSDLILLRDSIDNRKLSDKVFDSMSIHEHELIHRLIRYQEGGKPEEEINFEEFFEEIGFEPQDELRIVTSRKLAEKYDVPEEDTEAITLSDRDFNSLITSHRQPQNYQEIPLEDRNMQELFVHYLSSTPLARIVPLKSLALKEYGFDRDQILEAEDSLEKLDKKNGYDMISILEDFSTYESFEEFIEDTEDLPKVSLAEKYRTNGFLTTPYESKLDDLLS